MTNYQDNRQIRVFISSTFRDMQDERDELMKKTFPMLRQMAAERDVTLTEIDLRWGITEEESKSGKVVEICLREIENSVPFFIGIIGNRYGWIPKPEDIGGSLTERFPKVPEYVERHLSVTEMEMQFGVLARPEDMHAYFFIKEPEIPDKEEPKKLDDLKKAVRANKRYPVSNYSSREDLARQVEEAFRKLLDDLFPAGALSALEKERLGQRAYMNSLCQIYIRAKKNYAAIDKWMEDWEKHQLVITGASGLGKSALVANWTRDKLTKEKNLPYKIIYHAVGSGGSLGSDWHVVKSLCDEIRDLYGFDANEASPKTDEKALQELFDRVAFEGDKPLLIVLDAINQIIDVNHAKRLNWLPIPPKNVKILFTTLEDDETMRVFQDRHYPVFTLRPLTRRERIRMVRKYLSIFSKKLKPEQVARIVDDRQSDNTLVMKTLLDELVNFGIYEKLDEKIEEFLKPDSYEDFYQVLLQNYEASFGEQRVRHFLSLIAVSRNGLTEDEILSITQEKPLHWSQFFCSFRQHLIVKNGLVSFSHSYIREAVEGRYIKGNEEWVKSCREEIIAALENQKTPRSMNEVPYQLDKLDDTERLHEFLLDLVVFSHLYRNEETTLGKYIRKLIDTSKYSLLEYLELTSHVGECKQVDILMQLSSFTRNTIVNPSLSILFIEKALSIADSEKVQAEVLNMLGLSYGLLGDYRKELDFHLRSLDIFKKIYGDNHPDVAQSYNNVGVTYWELCDFQKALEYERKALFIIEKNNGRYHPKTASSYNNVGVTLGALNVYQEALEYEKIALEIRRVLFGDSHPDVAISLNNVGLTYGELGNYPKALDYEKRALVIRREFFGNNHPDVADSYHNVGYIYDRLGDHKNALVYKGKALATYSTIFEDNHPVIANAYDNIGSSYVALGDNQKAFEFKEKALEIRKHLYDDNHLDLATSYNNVGWTLGKLGNYQKALDYEEKALTILRKVLGENHSMVVNTYFNASIMLAHLGNKEAELAFLIKALHIAQRINKLDYTAVLLNHIAKAYKANNQPERARDYYRRAAEKYRELGDEVQAQANLDEMENC